MTNLFNTADVAAARQDDVEANIGTDWFERENFGVRFLSESDFPVGEDTTDDWDFYFESTYVDPAERHW